MPETIKVQKLGKDLIIIIPTEISQKLGIKEGLSLDMEPFTCGGDIGIRMKIKI